jgi:hypothetical protein
MASGMVLQCPVPRAESDFADGQVLLEPLGPSRPSFPAGIRLHGKADHFRSVLYKNTGQE